MDTHNGSDLWQSVEEIADRCELGLPEILKAIPQHFLSRREFIEWTGGLLAVLGTASCTRPPKQKILPYVKQPETVVPGRATFYASSHLLAGVATGILVESHLGRPTKIEGNPEHVGSLGATDAMAQASILDLYDPDRSQTPLYRGVLATWSNFVGHLDPLLATQLGKQGAGLALLVETSTSPSLAEQIREFEKRYPKARVFSYDAVSRDNAYAGSTLAFGDAHDVFFKVEAAKVVFSLDSNFLCEGPGHVRYAREFAGRRNPAHPNGMNRLYALETTPTNTGSLADHRTWIRPSQLEAAARYLAYQLGATTESGGEALSSDQRRFLTVAAQDLKAAGSQSLVVAGDYASARIHAMVHAINRTLHNTGVTTFAIAPLVETPRDQRASLRDLHELLSRGAVEALFVVGGNPVFTAPADLALGDKIAKVPFSAHLATHWDETSERCLWHLPLSHTLESWGDAKAYDGTLSLIQPLIAPLYDSKSPNEFLSVLLGHPSASGYDSVREYWKRQWGAGFEAKWNRAVRDGFVAGSAGALRSPSVRTAQIFAGGESSGSGKGIEISFRPDPHIWDGRFANNGWLQELPKPLTKLTWDNVILIPVSLATNWKVRNGDVVEVKLSGKAVEGPIWIMPGQAENTLTIGLGYGRSRGGKVATGAGFNAYTLRTTQNFWSGSGAEVKRTGKSVALACTQKHFSMEGRGFVRTASLAQYQTAPDTIVPKPHGAEEHAHAPTVNGGPNEDPLYAWGMAINLNTCTGCNACVVACQSENNIPVVGKDQVIREREMHWLRIDRYFEGPIEDPKTYFQPVPCMHCETAPCEVVCPVAATSHSPEGINEMTYNRCVGTKYCSNNCPYKVRRFNFHQFTDKETASLKPMRNPDVTVRTRGVMEKCTYCVQRVNAARIEAKKEGRPIQDGEIKTACQSACPSQSIVFGNLKDAKSEVSTWKSQPTNYGLLDELGTRPRTTYLARVSNPNSSLGKGENA